ncbi:MAG: rhodanese-like domain-containing protein [Brumimicrobium sp.]|nr:rhodanese-like domain-containing protein [Brumimicrobium sp.]
MGLFQKLFKGRTVPSYSQLKEEGAQIIDVRTREEFRQGHIKGSINLPLDELNGKINQLNKEKAVITCCASGMRSGAAKRILKAKGFNVYNGGGWRSLNDKI